MISIILLAAFLSVVFVLVVRMRGRFVLDGAEGMAIVAYAFLGLLQGATQHQVQFDDYIFTPFYLAIPIWLGAARGPSHGFIGTLLCVCALAIVAAIHPMQGRVGGELEDLLHQEWLLALVVLAAMACIAGFWRTTRPLGGFLAFVWAIFILAVQPGLLLSISPWIGLAIAAALTSIGLAVIDAVSRTTLSNGDLPPEAG